MSGSEILRSAIAQAQPYEQRLSGLTEENDLFAALGMETESQAQGKSAFAGIPRVVSSDDLNQSSALVSAGRRIFARWNKTLHEFACKSDETDKELQSDLLRALTGREGGTALIAGVLVAAFGMSLVPATLVATLLLKIVIVPAGAEVCEIWGAAIAKGQA
ncbi:MAG: hypothetical protein WAS21_33390 [Geminicoccaceae bacterium]